jgi:RimJ/RimL family protein N-acetyltransferase
MELSTARLLLRPWRFGDEEALVRHGDNPNVSRYLRDRFPCPYRRSDAEGWLAHVTTQPGPPTAFALVVAGEPVGGIGIDLLDDVYRVGGELGYWLGESFWGRGYASEAVQVLVPYAFDTLDLLRVQAGVYGPNVASTRVLEKAGFVLEGTMRRAALKRGELHDVLLYARLR